MRIICLTAFFFIRVHLRSTVAVASSLRGSFLNAGEDGDHFQSGLGGFLAGVAVGATGAVPGLLLGVGGENAEDDGQRFGDGDLLDAASGFTSDVIEVRGVAADDAAE